ncbi:MAG: hypothetical protein EHM42_04095 [Planctomycetaceae bacterium]|nr:MAG: hypothetical protein EHM42_04095 [Planctomycetaceae bacterium]
MHISGRIFGFIAVILGLASVYLSAKAMGVRQAWMEKAQKNEEDLKKKQQLAIDARAERDKKRAEYVRAIVGWDRFYEGPNVQAGIDQDGGVLVDGVGTANGVRQEDVIYVFIPGQDAATSTFLGAFKVTEAADARVRGRPHWRVRQGDLAPTNQKFLARVRTLVPPRYQAELASLDQQLLVVEQSYTNAVADKDFLAQLQDRTNLLIADRNKELNGDPDLADHEVPDVYKVGLLASIAKEEEVRNAALLEGDQLLRRLLKTRQTLESLIDSNRELTKTLPQPPATPATVGVNSR